MAAPVSDQVAPAEARPRGAGRGGAPPGGGEGLGEERGALCSLEAGAGSTMPAPPAFRLLWELGQMLLGDQKAKQNRELDKAGACRRRNTKQRFLPTL